MPPSPSPSTADLQAIIARYWGFSSLRPLQDQAMRAVLDGRDSLVVMPTGGGKSLCYQAPAVLQGGLTVVVSPLIALMKDQVDGLRACGVNAAQLDSSLTSSERIKAEAALKCRALHLLFVSPERLVQSDLYKTLRNVGVRNFAIDEAHCISHWGHDFRPEYRQLAPLREHFPGASVHGYTATATEQVRRDIIAQLQLRDPEVLVGNFDRPNLTYRVWPRHEALKQVLEVLDRHPAEAGIVYCMRRRDVDDLTAKLQQKGVKALPYHAGLSPEQRQQTQEAFSGERIDVVVATIAFGMGIDRSNVRFVLHTAMPKSLEHYQQETGRAGRDGLEAECVLLYSGGDIVSMKAMIEKSAREAGETAHLPAVMKHLDDMDRYARGAVCRHKALVSYFGQGYDTPSCGACDLCLGDTEDVPEADTVAQKILSCVARVKENFGIGHVIDVLRGKANEKVRQRGHDKLTVYGLLKETSDNDVRDWIYQLIGQEALIQTQEEYPKLRLNGASWEVMRKQRSVRLVQLVRRKKGEKPRKSQAAEVSWEGVDEALFGKLRALRRELASERQVSAFLIFNDATLRSLAGVQPTSLVQMRGITGVGDVKLRDFGERFLAVITEHLHGGANPSRTPGADGTGLASPGADATGLARPAQGSHQEQLFDLFRGGHDLALVARQTNLRRETVVEALLEFIRTERPDSLSPWVDRATYDAVAQAARQVGTTRARPIWLALGERIELDAVRLVLAHLQATAE
jgi:ATP-dependent DNA helicase RecQ